MITALFIIGAVIASSAQLVLMHSQRDSDGSPIPARTTMTPHDPVVIVGNGGFLTTDAVRGGSGTPANPYVISDWAINATDGIGIYIISTTANFVVRNVTINSSAQNNDGIRLEGVSNAQIHNVTISNCFDGIAVYSGCSWLEVSESTISTNANCGIMTQGGVSSYFNITGNMIFANGGTGIALDSVSQFSLTSNVVTTNDPSSGGRRAVTLTKCAQGVLTGNVLKAIYNEALRCNTCQNVIVAANEFNSTWSYGVSLLACSGFLVYGNNFMGVPPQAYDNWGSENAWNASYPTGGNYWVDYTGEDKHGGVNQDQGGPDGIGDTPYVIDLNTTDYYPLNLSGPIEPIPEFPTLLLPIMSILSLLFAVIRRSSRREA